MLATSVLFSERCWVGNPGCRQDSDTCQGLGGIPLPVALHRSWHRNALQVVSQPHVWFLLDFKWSQGLQSSPTPCLPKPGRRVFLFCLFVCF